jgi:hypothetical protein
VEKLDSVERQYWYHGYCAGRMDERKAIRDKQLSMRLKRLMHELWQRLPHELAVRKANA